MKEIPSNSIPDNKEPDLHKLIRQIVCIVGGLVSITYLGSELITALSPVHPVDNSVNARLAALTHSRDRILGSPIITDEKAEVLKHIHEEMMRILPEEVLPEEQKMPVIQE